MEIEEAFQQKIYYHIRLLESGIGHWHNTNNKMARAGLKETYHLFTEEGLGFLIQYSGRG